MLQALHKFMHTFLYNDQPLTHTMILVNYLFRLLFLPEELCSEKKIKETIICLIFICLQENIGEQGFTFFVKGQKPMFTLIFQLQSTKNNLAQGVAYEPEALIVGTLGGLVYSMSIGVEIPVKICVGAISNQQ